MGHPLEWTARQDAILREGYATWKKPDLAQAISAHSPDGRTYSWSAIIGRANRMGLKRGTRALPANVLPQLWTEAQLAYLRRHYGIMENDKLLEGLARLGKPRSLTAAFGKASEIGLVSNRRTSSWKASIARRRAPVATPDAPPAEEPKGFLATQKHGVNLLASRPAPELRTIAAGEPDTAHEKVVSKQEKAWNLLWRNRDASDVARETGLQLREVLRIAMDVREARRAQRAA